MSADLWTKAHKRCAESNCAGCQEFHTQVEADLVRLNRYTAQLVERYRLQFNLANHGCIEAQPSDTASNRFESSVPLQAQQELLHLDKLRTFSSEEKPTDEKLRMSGDTSVLAASSPRGSSPLEPKRAKLQCRLFSDVSEEGGADEIVPVQSVTSAKLRSSFGDVAVAMEVRLPKVLLERQVAGVEAATKSFAPQDPNLARTRGQLDAGSPINMIQPLGTLGTASMESEAAQDSQVTKEVTAPGSPKMNSLRSGVKKLRLLSLWEEAYALADEEIDETVPRPIRSGATVRKFSSVSSRTAKMLKQQRELSRHRLWENIANPHSSYHLAWDVLGLFLTTYDMAAIPIEIAWDFPNENKGTPLWLVVLEIFYWTFDLFLSFFRGFYYKGVVVWDPARIRQRYLRSWFACDLVLILVDCLLVFSRFFEITALVQATMWVRLVRMWRVLKMRRTAKKLEEACITWRVPAATLVHAVIYTMAMILLLTHIVACMWFYLGRINHSRGKDNWLSLYDVGDTEIAHEYLLSFHWVLGQFTPAPMNITPANPEERFFTILVIFFTLFVLGKGYQKVSQTLQELHAARHSRIGARRQMQQFLAMHKIPLDLAVRTTRFADHVLSRRERVELDDSLVSEHLRQELTMHQRSGYLVDHPLFKMLRTAYPESISRVCEALSQHSYDKGRAIFTAGSIARCLYITSQGAFYIEKEEYHEFINDTKYLSEISLYASVMHISTLHATTFCDAFTLTAADFKHCVHPDPGCSKLVLEYANSLLAILRREGQIDDSLPVAHSQTALAQTSAYRAMNADPYVITESRSESQGKDSMESSKSEVESEQKTAETVAGFLRRLQAGEIEDIHVAPECERVFTEVDPLNGVYAKLLYQDERVRTLASMVNTLWLWNNNYDAFAAPQPNFCKISMALWRKIQRFVSWVGTSTELMHASLVMIAVRGLGNLAPLVKELPKTHQRSSKAVAYLLRDPKRRFVKHIPSAQALPDSLRRMVADAFEIHDIFNLGQFMEGENLPYNIQQLQNLIQSRDHGDVLLKLYLLAVVGIMSGRELRSNFESGYLDVLPGSRFIDERRGRKLMACIEVLEHVLSSPPQAIYWSYMSAQTNGMQLETVSAEELALSRLMCLSRTHTMADAYHMRHSWENMQEVDRSLLTDCLLADGITQRSIRFIYLPMCLANARGNPCVGLGKFLTVLAELLELLKANGCWGRTEAMTLTLDLQDLASFIVSVNNIEVFSTCLLRAELRQLDSRITIAMTSRNWMRATDTDNHEVAMIATVHSVYQKQRSIEFAVEAQRTQVGRALENGAVFRKFIGQKSDRGSSNGTNVFSCQHYNL